mgnify:CR=1 FL=1
MQFLLFLIECCPIIASLVSRCFYFNQSQKSRFPIWLNGEKQFRFPVSRSRFCIIVDDPTAYTLQSKLNTHGTNPVIAMDFQSQHNIGVCAGAGSQLVVTWSVKDDELVKMAAISTASKGFNCVRLRPDCKMVVACAWDGVVRLYSPKKGTLLSRMDFHREGVLATCFNHQNYFITSSRDGLLCLWNLYAADMTGRG